MDSHKYFENVFSQLMEQLGLQDQNVEKDINIKGPNGNIIQITPRKALVLAGILLGVLTIDSVVLNVDKTFEIVLLGTLEKKTQLDKCVQDLGKMSLEEVVKLMKKNL